MTQDIKFERVQMGINFKHVTPTLHGRLDVDKTFTHDTDDNAS